MRVKRNEALDLLKRPERQRVPVLATGGGRPAQEVRSAKDLPAEPAEDFDGPPLELHRMRDDQGNWTRVAMEHAIRTGGSVMHHGEIFTRLDQLPDEAELAAIDAARLKARAAQLDAQHSNMSTERTRLQEQIDEAEGRAKEGAKAAAARKKAEHAAAAEAEAKQAGDKSASAAGHGQAGHGQAGHGQAGHGHTAAADKDKEKK